MRGSRDPAPRRCRWLILALALWACVLCARAAETLPPKPAAYFNDYAAVVDAATASTLDERLRQFERDTSNQIVVAVFRKMGSDSSVADYTVRVAQSWNVGQEKKDNGAVLFVFVEDRKMFIQVGYGLEGALPDAVCKRIVEEELKPRFRTSDYAGGLTAGVDAMIKATRGEYQGTGRVAGDGSLESDPTSLVFPLIFGLLFFVHIYRLFRSGTQYTKRGRSSTWWGPMGGFGGGGWSSGSGGGGGFSGGGGSFGGGGAGGNW